VSYLYLSAAHKSSGKTTISVGLTAALKKRGLKVQTFKKGPDYIDPLWLQEASSQPCYNLDFNTQSHDEIKAMFTCHMAGPDIGLIEGNKGLYDGVALDGSDSNAALAQYLKAPVVLVIDVMGITRGIAPLLIGYEAFAPELTIAGVIFNKVASSRHESKLRASVEHYTDMAVVGAVPRNEGLLAPERHLGLIPPKESKEASARVDELAAMMDSHLDLELILKMAQRATLPIDQEDTTSAVETVQLQIKTQMKTVRIGIARDSAFGFYYADDLDALKKAGAELVFFNTLEDKVLPAVDGLFLGGGFPETHLQALEENKGLRADLKKAAQGGLPIYAECGGLMYLSKSIEWQGRRAQMVGFIPGTVTMHKKPQGRGLVRVRETGAGLWPKPGVGGAYATITAHEFHYASLQDLPPDTVYAHKVERGYGIDGESDAIVLNNVQAGFCHHRTTLQNKWAVRFVEFVQLCKNRSNGMD